MASCPFAASPTTSIPSSSARIIRKPFRTSCWSSTRSTRTVMSSSRSRQRQPGETMRNPAGGRLGRQAAPEHRNPLSHPDQAATLVGRLDRCGSARSSLIVDLEFERLGLVPDRHPSTSAARMLQRVGESLLDDPVRGEFEAGVELGPASPPRTARRQAPQPEPARPGRPAARALGVAPRFAPSPRIPSIRRMSIRRKAPGRIDCFEGRACLGRPRVQRPRRAPPAWMTMTLTWCVTAS